jgi:hypothetical protein
MNIVKLVLFTVLLGTAYSAYPEPHNTNVAEVRGTIKEQ